LHGSIKRLADPFRPPDFEPHGPLFLGNILEKGDLKMALINCSECGNEVSDKWEKCVHCDRPLNITLEKPSITKAKSKCPKCGVERRPGDTECWNLRCRVIYEKYEAYIAKKRAAKDESITTFKVEKIEIPQQEAAGPKTHPATICCAVIFVLATLITIFMVA